MTNDSFDLKNKIILYKIYIVQSNTRIAVTAKSPGPPACRQLRDWAFVAFVPILRFFLIAPPFVFLFLFLLPLFSLSSPSSLIFWIPSNPWISASYNLLSVMWRLNSFRSYQHSPLSVQLLLFAVSQKLNSHASQSNTPHTASEQLCLSSTDPLLIQQYNYIQSRHWNTTLIGVCLLYSIKPSRQTKTLLFSRNCPRWRRNCGSPRFPSWGWCIPRYSDAARTRSKVNRNSGCSDRHEPD